MTSSLGPWFDYTINGLVVGNIYALLAVGLALIYGVSHLINFAHGSVYMVGAYIGWLCITYLGTPLPVTLAAVVAGSALIGVGIERIGLHPLQGSPRIAPLLATIGKFNFRAILIKSSLTIFCSMMPWSMSSI